MKAAVSLPAPDGLTEDLMGKAIYELLENHALREQIREWEKRYE